MLRPKVLIIDDDAAMRKALSSVLTSRGYEPVTAMCGRDGILAAEKEDIVVALIALRLPDMPGTEVLKRVKSGASSPEAILLEGYSSPAAGKIGYEEAFSTLQKPYEVEQILLHIKRAVAKKQANKKEITQGLELPLEAEEPDVAPECGDFLVDPLTGLPPGHSAEKEIRKLFASAKKYGNHCSVILMGIDQFQRYREMLGDGEADALLITIANILSAAVRNSDYVCRHTGEDFLVVLPRTELIMACKVAERLRETVEANSPVTVSVGVSSCLESVRELISQAAKGLYKAKQNGGNRVEVGFRASSAPK